MSAKQIYDLYRALYSFKAVTAMWQNTTKIKFIELKLIENDRPSEQIESAGSAEYIKSDKFLKVKCADGYHLAVYKLAVEGKKIMTAMDFNNGFIKKLDKFDKLQFT